MIENIVLDWGYVLAYPTTGNWFVSPEAKEILGWKNMLRVFFHKKALKEDLRIACAGLNEDHLLENEEKEYQQFMDFFEVMLTQLGVKKDKSRLVQELAKDLVFNPEHVQIYEDTKTGIQKLQEQYRVMILSDNWPSLVSKMKHSGVDELIKEVVISCEHGICKDNVKLFQIAIDQWKINPQQSVFVDDSITNLINAEKEGFHSILMDRTGKVTESDFPIAHTMEDVLCIVNQMK